MYQENKNKIGKIDDVFGQPATYGFVVQLEEGVTADSFKKGHKIYGDPRNMLWLSKFKEPTRGAPPLKPLNMQGKVPQRGGRGGRGGFGGGGRF